MNNQIVCLVGESGSGKTTLAEALKNYGIKSINSFTTRPKRYPGEKGHVFVNQKFFDNIRDRLVAYAKFSDYEYGTTLQQVQQNDIYVIDLNGVIKLKKNIGEENVKVVYLKTDPKTRIKRMEETRSVKDAYKRANHDRHVFNSVGEHADIILRNERKEDFDINKAIVKTLYDGWLKK